MRRFGASHADVFGSVARGEATADSDVDGEFSSTARLKLYISEILDEAGDVVNRRTLKPLLRDSIRRDAIHAF